MKEIETFEGGAIREKKPITKGRYDLIPWEAIHELAIHCAEGAAVHGERNCEKGITMHSFLDSAMRHLSLYMQGERKEPHLRSAFWNIGWAIWTEIRHPERQDIPARQSPEGSFEMDNCPRCGKEWKK